MRKSLIDHLDKIEKQTVEEMLSVEQNTQKKVEIVIFVTFEILEINTTIN
jgi:hypothetical protein